MITFIIMMNLYQVGDVAFTFNYFENKETGKKDLIAIPGNSFFTLTEKQKRRTMNKLYKDWYKIEKELFPKSDSIIE